MKIVICGAGQVGYGIAESLAAEGNDVTVIDTSPTLIARIRETIDARGIVGHGAFPEVLTEAGAAEADMLIAVTLHDEVNMVACQVAHSLFNVPTKIARIRSQAYLDTRHESLFSSDSLPIDVVISPELEVAQMVLRRIALPGALDTVRFSDEAITLLAIECREDCPILATPLGQLSELFPDLGATVVGIMRDDAIFIPNSVDQLYADDLAYVVVEQIRVRRTLTLFGHEEPDVGRIVIAGGGNVGVAVARAMEKQRLASKLRIIEADRARALHVADELKKTIVLHGSALDPAILEEAEIGDADLLVSLTNDDQVNILSSAMAKRLGAKSNMALLNGRPFQALAKSVGIDAVISPKSVTISRILQHVRRGRIRAVHSVQNGLAEVIEIEALETSPLVGQPLKDLNLPDGMRIGAVSRNGVFMRPNAQTRIRPKDRVVIFMLSGSVRQVEQFFRVRLEFF
ncbi:Trk system potassium transporter TrkA [Aureimonas pseudogalii]|uniref:Trk system potassium uptake protein TrkA n=1 Tax=Aureimonas pseudogalii TaxID=1744844 RepID=A0A7W6MJU3_9HYPH|nr:Trk system potassium transporter TrkA [Aureimonas pseudogalii]MBB3998654.1 trk system potassium uptake protein TrkA [Aureimonas pseudogalii]